MIYKKGLKYEKCSIARVVSKGFYKPLHMTKEFEKVGIAGETCEGERFIPLVIGVVLFIATCCTPLY